MDARASAAAPLVWCAVADSDSCPANERARLAQRLAPDSARSDRVLLATCQRVELYGSGVVPAAAPAGMRLLSGEAAIRRLFRVAAGLESAVTGEDEVLGQLRAAYVSAAARGPRDVRLGRLFEAAIATGRRCRAGRGPTGGGLASLAARTLLERSGGAGGTVVVAGAGYMGAALASSLAPRCPELIVASRRLERAQGLAARLGARATTLIGAASEARTAGGVAVALAAPWPATFEPGSLPTTVDVSSPPAVPASACVEYFGIDDFLASKYDGGRGYGARAGAVVDAALASYLDSWQRRAVAS